jgi:mono/diheme cytochrome c family protein
VTPGAVWRGIGALVSAGALVACSDPGAGLSPEAERGRQIYVAQCTACHAMNPAQSGPLGPAVQGSSQALLEARLLRGGYPPGYTPKRDSRVMQPMPHLAESLPDLSAYLR